MRPTDSDLEERHAVVTRPSSAENSSRALPDHQTPRFSRVHPIRITILKLSLVVLVGPSGSGKSTFARTHFKPTEIPSSDACRVMVSDDVNDQSVTKDAFEVL